MRSTFVPRKAAGVLACLVLACRLAAQQPEKDDPSRLEDLERRMKKLEKLAADARSEPAVLEWMAGADGSLRRKGWSAHAAYRWSLPHRLFDYYFRSLEPIVRYSELRTNQGSSPFLPGTWDRKQVLLGRLVEVTGNVMLDIEYAIQLEKTGGACVGAPSSVDNNELLEELAVTF